MRKITLLKSGNRLVVDVISPQIRDILAPFLTFTEQKWFHGAEAREAKKLGHPPFESVDWECFGQDHRCRISTYWGFYKRITDVLKKHNYRVVVRDLLPTKKPELFVPQWDMLETFGIQLKYGQAELLAELFSHRGGRIDCPPGFGKSYLIGVIGILLPKTRIGRASCRERV